MAAQIAQFIGIGFLALGAMVVLMNQLNERYKAANDAVKIAVDTQRQFNDHARNTQTKFENFLIASAEERGAFKATQERLERELSEEREKAQTLSNELREAKAENAEAVAKLTADSAESQSKINRLTEELNTLKDEQNKIRDRLNNTLAERDQLVNERDTLQTNLSALESTIDAKIKAAVDKAVAELRNEYEGRLESLNQQIIEKDAEIARLRALVEENAHVEDEKPVEDGGNLADAGDLPASDSTGRDSDSDSNG